VNVLPLTEGLEGRWTRFVEASPQSTCAHQLEWRDVVVRTYAHVPYYLMAMAGDDVRGVLPLFLIRSPLFGRFLVTAPYLSVGGLLTDGPEAAHALVEGARRLMVSVRARYVEFRNLAPVGLDLVSTDRYCSYELPLAPGPDGLWARFENRARTAIRKAQASGLSVERGRHHLLALADVLSQHMRALGTPFHGPAFYRHILSTFGDRAEIFVVRTGERIVGSGLTLLTPPLLHWPYGACLASARAAYPMNLLTWEIIRFACSTGARTLDFGRSRWHSGTALFKRQWGAVPVPLFYEFLLGSARAVPLRDPANPRYAIPISVWRRLPLAITRSIGPAIIRDLP
jgi:FemAB-related protein (PEP-CTERM system-associated)